MNKVVLVTGGSSGIGKATAAFLAGKDFTVYGTGRNPGKIKNSEKFRLLQLDVSDEASIKKAVNAIIKEEGKIDILINNAGVGITGAVEEIPNEEIHKAFVVNLYGPISVMKAVLPYMRKRKKGLIINITSIAGYMGLPYRGVYSATKGALELITEAMRMEVKDFGVHIANVAPGDFATNIASGRYHTPVYGDSPYKKPYGGILKMINEDVDSGDDPVKVAQMIHKIIQTKRPRIHYKAGAFMEKFSIVLKRILPDKMYEKLLCNHYKL